MHSEANVFLALSLDYIAHDVLIGSAINVYCIMIPHSKDNYISCFYVGDTNFLITAFVNFQSQGLSIKLLKLLKSGFLLAKLKSSLRTLHGPHHDFVDLYGIYVS